MTHDGWPDDPEVVAAMVTLPAVATVLSPRARTKVPPVSDCRELPDVNENAVLVSPFANPATTHALFTSVVTVMVAGLAVPCATFPDRLAFTLPTPEYSSNTAFVNSCDPVQLAL